MMTELDKDTERFGRLQEQISNLTAQGIPNLPFALAWDDRLWEDLGDWKYKFQQNHMEFHSPTIDITPDFCSISSLPPQFTYLVLDNRAP